jgi:hypothetical protein
LHSHSQPPPFEQQQDEKSTALKKDSLRPIFCSYRDTCPCGGCGARQWNDVPRTLQNVNHHCTIQQPTAACKNTSKAQQDKYQLFQAADAIKEAPHGSPALPNPKQTKPVSKSCKNAFGKAKNLNEVIPPCTLSLQSSSQSVRVLHNMIPSAAPWHDEAQTHEAPDITIIKAVPMSPGRANVYGTCSLTPMGTPQTTTVPVHTDPDTAESQHAC